MRHQSGTTRREALRLLGVAPVLARGLVEAAAKLPTMKITRIRYYQSPISRPMFNQSFDIVTVETDQGVMGIGEGGSRDTVEECAQMLIGEDARRIDHCWQLMLRGRFYPAGRE